VHLQSRELELRPKSARARMVAWETIRQLISEKSRDFVNNDGTLVRKTAPAMC
jgi:hypothetical protein